jgi:hypothetical protein
MNQQSGTSSDKPGKDDKFESDKARDNQENEIEAEQESAAAMDADVPQPEDADVSKGGQLE